MTGFIVSPPMFPKCGSRRPSLTGMLAVLMLTAFGGIPPLEAGADEDIAETIIGSWMLDREATSERLSQQSSDDAPTELPAFEMNLYFKEGSVTTEVIVSGISKKQGFRWRVLEEPSESTALIEFLPTTGLPRRHTFRVLSDGRLALDAQGAKYTLILTRRSTP